MFFSSDTVLIKGQTYVLVELLSTIVDSISDLEKRVKSLEEQIVKRDFIIDLPDDVTGRIMTYRLTAVLTSILDTIQKPHRRLEQIEADIIEIKTQLSQRKKALSDNVRNILPENDWIS